uniref:family 16 glycoside hydrolase n=1 Tax=Ningiella ruwaisensis TaxID=2364274 RepID=UPI00109F8422|nr:family 16 glycoside hydrolase [Ningiella ruwaisensis]
MKIAFAPSIGKKSLFASFALVSFLPFFGHSSSFDSSLESSLNESDQLNAEQSNSETQTVFTGEFFQDAPHWVITSNVKTDGKQLLAQTDEMRASGTYIFTPAPVSTDFEDTSSHIMSKDYYGDKIVNLEFMLLPDSRADVLLMGRYPVRLAPSQETNEISLQSAGAIGQFWDEWNKDNPNRSFGGAIPLNRLNLEPNKWHSFEASVRTPRYDEAHNKVENALIMSVYINGELVQKNVIAESPSQNATFHWEEQSGPLVFDAIEGQTAIRNVSVARADFSNITLPDNSGGETNESDLINFVEVGKNAFKNYGCAECHSVKANDVSVKTGPNLYGLFQREVRKREVLNQEKHRYEVRADKSYLLRSIRNAEAELAIVEGGNKAGEPYLPIMPRYTEQVIPDKDISAMYSYLLSRNDLWQRGPLVQLETAEGPEEYDPMQDPMQFLVQDRIRIQRGPLPDVSGRAIHVGHPNGLHYSFDPRNLSVAKIWQGGFLETSGELSGRGGKGFAIGYQAIENNLGEFGGLIRPYNAAGNLVDFSFKSPKFEDYERIKESAYSTRSFEERYQEQDARFKGYFRDSTDALSPVTFFYEVSGNNVSLTPTILPNGDVDLRIEGEFKTPQRFALNTDILKNIKVSQGQLENGEWVLKEGKNINAKLSAQITTIDTPWLAPDKAFTYESQAFVKQNGKANLPPGYAIEDWMPPKDNAGREHLFEAIGLDALENGDILVSTRTAGVWKVSNNQWKLVAEGIFDSLGVLSESADGSQAVVGNKAELTRIRDVNGDGIADYYDTLFDSFTNAGDYHAYIHGPTRDKAGNYVMTINLANNNKAIAYHAGGNVMGSFGGYQGWAVRVSPDGAHTYFANGLRSPAGLGTDLDGQVWYADNQGDFVGSSKIFILDDGKFYGHPAGLIDEAGMTPDSPEVTWEAVIDRKEKAPIVVAHGKVANSLGNPVWDSTEGGFGPYSKQMFIGDQTQSNLSRTVVEKVNGQWQGAMIPFASGMASGVMRPIFLSDSSMLLGQTGRGWQAKGGNAAALQRITYDGTSIALDIKNVTITEDGFTLELTKALPDTISLEDIQSGLSVNSWTYRDAPAYGSEELGATDNGIQNIALNEKRNMLTVQLQDASIPDVHPQQTARVFHIKLEHPELNKLSGKDTLNAFYSAHSFR